jgi:hypothetical protein
MSRQRVPWTCDGPDDDTCLMNVLLEWLNTGKKYTRWRGSDTTNGTTKLVMVDEIVRLTQQACITTERKTNHVNSKIGTLDNELHLS